MALFALGHMGITAALVELLHRRWPGMRLDYRVVLLGSLFSDMVDKPIGILLGIEGRSIAHTLLFTVALTVFLLMPLIAPHLYPRVIARRLSNPLSLLIPGLWTHLLLDRMWEQLRVLLWPLAGGGFMPMTFDLFELLAAIVEPYVLAGEVVGVTILVAIGLRYRLYRWKNLVRFVRTGRAEA